MLKLSKDYSLKGVVLLFLVTALGLFFRLYNLNFAGETAQEIASFYYARNLDRVFFTTAQSPLYLALCQAWFWIFPSSIVSLKYFSVAMSFGFGLVTSSLILSKQSLNLSFLFFTLWWLSPLDIGLSRIATPQGLITQMSILIFLLFFFKVQTHRGLLWCLLSFYQLLHPSAMFFVWILIAFDLGLKKTSWHEARFSLTTSFPAVAYSGLRFIFIGPEFLQDLSMISLSLVPLGAVVILKKQVFKNTQAAVLGLGLALGAYTALLLRPWAHEQGLGPSVEHFKSYLKNLSPRELVICASAPELDYYFQRAYYNCSTEVLKHQLQKQSFYLFSLDGEDQLLISFLKAQATIERTIKFNQGQFLSVTYPPKS